MKRSYSNQAYSGVIEQVYAAASNCGSWQQVIASIAETTGSTSACMPTTNTPGFAEENLDFNIPYELHREYCENLVLLDRLSEYAREQTDFTGSTSEVFAARPDLRVDEFEARMDHYGQAERWGANLSPNVALSLHRHKSQGEYDRQDAAFLNSLVPHLRNAVEIHERLARVENQRDSFAEYIGQLGMGVILLDQSGKVHLVNEQARITLRDNALLDITQFRLHSPDKQLDPQLQQRLCSVLNGQRSAECMRLGRGLNAVELRISPLRPATLGPKSDLGEISEFIVFLSEADQVVNLHAEHLRKLYNLTNAEAETLHLLANDCTVADIARIRHISQATVRGQLQSLREKNGAERQTTVVKMALASTARFAVGV